MDNKDEILYFVSRGDEIAFEKLFHHYRDRVYSIAFKLLHSTELSEELTEDVFLKVWLNREKLPGIQNFPAYLFAIARHEVYRILKLKAKTYTVCELSDQSQLRSVNETENYIMEKEYSQVLRKAVDRLPGQQRQVYHLMKEQELKRDAVANLLQLQPETVKYHLAQAMKSIRSFCLLHLRTFFGFLWLSVPSFV